MSGEMMEQATVELWQELAKVTQELNAVTQERDEGKRQAEYQQQQVTQLRKRVEALEASVDQEQGRANRLQRWAADLQAQLEAAAVDTPTNEQVPFTVNLEWTGPNDVLKLENEELKKQIEEYKAAARQALVQHEGTKGLLREVQIERDHQKELLGVYKSMQRLIETTFSDDV